jgi:site-specific DNA-methyltransferase (adenine-specific)
MKGQRSGGEPLWLRGVVVRRNVRQQMNGYVLLRKLAAESAALVFFDPQYRSVLDKLAFGNEGARQKKRAKLQQMSDDEIIDFVEQIDRVLRPGGHMGFWMDKFSIASGHHHRFYARAPRLKVVDLICWSTLRFGMGRRTRGAGEYLVILQKLPTRAKDVWTDRAIRDVWPESSNRTAHPHAKPAELIERLIRSTTKPGDLVVDPCAGSYVVLEACGRTGREFAGCDLQ